MSRGQGEIVPPYFRHNGFVVFGVEGRFDMDISVIDLLQLILVFATCLGFCSFPRVSDAESVSIF